jgi:serine/threonine protein kinase
VSPSVGDTIGPYRIEACLAEGELVQIFQAVSQRDGELVALKVIPADLGDAEISRRFDRERDISRRVEHPNLVPVLDKGEDDRFTYLAIRYVDGRTVSRILEAEGAFDFESIVRLVSEIGAALDALHRAEIVHRDVTSGNVLVDDHGVAALTDLGFADSPHNETITELHRPVGTLDYRAPELFVGRPAEAASDIYSLGCVAYECLVARPPFADRRDLIELGRAHLNAAPPDPSALRHGGVPPAFSQAVLTALAKDPNRRPPSGAAYAKALRLGLDT